MEREFAEPLIQADAREDIPNDRLFVLGKVKRRPSILSEICVEAECGEIGLHEPGSRHCSRGRFRKLERSAERTRKPIARPSRTIWSRSRPRRPPRLQTLR